MEKPSRDFLFNLSLLPTRSEYVHDHLQDGLTERDQYAAKSIVAQITQPERPLARHQVLIPVAAHQEATQIAGTMEQYAAQQTTEPFSVILSLNSPTDHQNDIAIGATMTEVEKASERHPHLDVRSALTFYDSPKIGMIRRDLWNAALMLSVAEGAYTDTNDEFIGINHDIDLASLSPRYIQRIQHYYHRKQAHYRANGLRNAQLPPSSTLLRHALSPQHPNISKGVFWSDTMHHMSGAAFEAGLVFPLSHYALLGGFSANDTTYESKTLFSPETRPREHRIPGTIAKTSPRRYVDRLQHGFDAIWSNETFGSNDDCRTNSHERPDITHEQLETLLFQRNYLHESITPAINQVIRKAQKKARQLRASGIVTSDDPSSAELFAETVEHIRRKIIVSTGVARRVLQSPRAVDYLQNLADDRTRIEDNLQYYLERD